MRTSRRTFLWQVGAAAALARTPIARAAGASIVIPAAPAAPDIRGVAYAAITWGKDALAAIADISSAGYGGIQLRSDILPEWEKQPRALADELARRHLKLVAFSSGNVVIDPEADAEQIATHVGHARFVRDCGGLYLQCIDQRPKRQVVRTDYQRLGRLLTEIGKRTADLGIPLGYHHHMNSTGERPEEIDQIMEAADPRYVKLELDIAHYEQGGGDPVKAIRKFADRLTFMHIKDVESPVPGATGDLSRSYRFVELGRGKVDIKGVFAALEEVRFRDWIVVELDAVPDKARTPKESALINKKYLEEVIGLRVGASEGGAS
jgi:inosose dehydratase